jgi:hypothetical protein
MAVSFSRLCLNRNVSMARFQCWVAAGSWAGFCSSHLWLVFFYVISAEVETPSILRIFTSSFLVSLLLHWDENKMSGGGGGKIKERFHREVLETRNSEKEWNRFLLVQCGLSPSPEHRSISPEAATPSPLPHTATDNWRSDNYNWTSCKGNEIEIIWWLRCS